MFNVRLITGQTATGKTARALRMARESEADIISCDSRQLYRDASIVPGKDIDNTPYHRVSEFISDTGVTMTIGYYTLEGVRVWGHDIVDPKTVFSAGEFRQYFLYIMENTISKGSVPIVVGGTYLYIKHLLDGVDNQVSADWHLRHILGGLSVEELQKKLSKISPEVYAKLNHSDQNNPHRLIRKIEILQGEKQGEAVAPVIKPLSFIGLAHASKEILRERITKRVDERLVHGALSETCRLLDMRYTSEDPGLKAIGYKELARTINNEISLEQAKELWITAEVNYATRQMTFMKKDKRISWEKV